MLYTIDKKIESGKISTYMKGKEYELIFKK